MAEAQPTTTTTDRNFNKKNEERIMEVLGDLGGHQITDQSGIRKHEHPWVAIPREMTPDQLAKIAVDNAKAQSEEHTFSRTFRYRPWDGAHATQAALMKNFGTAGTGKAIQTLFGKQPPQFHTIDIGVNETTQVPWGRVQFPLFEGQLQLGGTEDREMGALFVLHVTCPKKYAAQVEGLFKLVQAELETNSIYRGKAFDGAEMPKFIDPYAVKREEIVYSQRVYDQLSANIWSLMRYTKVSEESNVPLKRSVLLAGPYGTGKSVAAMITAQEAVEGKWTFIQCRPGKDDLKKVMQTAQLYQPAVVFYEDVDTIAETGEPEKVQELMDLFDGITTKGTKLLMVLTTNHVEKIHKGMLRPGRLDVVIHIESLDAAGYERLIKANTPSNLLDDNIDWTAVTKEMTDFLPAFVKEAAGRAVRYAIARTGGKPDKLTTSDLVNAAQGLQPQLELMHGAKEGVVPPALDTGLRKLVREEMSQFGVAEDEGPSEAVYRFIEIPEEERQNA
jgi:transitional endoplasmic reticulum ATPase